MYRDGVQDGDLPFELPPFAEQPATPRRGRRRLLAVGFLLALAALVAVNWSMAVTGSPTPPFGVRSGLQGALNRLRGPVHVGLQVGHLDAGAQPDELANLRASTGAHAGGVDEVDINHAIVRALADRLEELGIDVDILPATIPAHYRADLVLAIHADASADPSRNGYKSAHYTPERNGREALLKLDVDRAVLLRSGLADDDRNVSGNMLQYYAFNARAFRHSVARSTPALLVEMGYLSNPRDRRLLEQPDRVARFLEDGIVDYLRTIGRLPRRGGA